MKVLDLVALFRCARGKLDAHAEFGMHDSNHAFGLNFHVFSFQAKDDSGTLRKRRYGFNVASTQAEIGELAFGNRLGIFGEKFRCVGDDPGFEASAKIFRQVDVADAGFAVGIGPGDFTANIHRRPIGKRETGTDDGGRTERLGRQNIHTVLAEIEQDAFHLGAVFNPKSYRKLDRHPEGAAAFALHQGHGGAQAGFGLLLRNGFVENEICAGAENVADFGLVAEQGDGYGLVPGDAW